MAPYRVSTIAFALLLIASHVKGVKRVTVDAGMRYSRYHTILIAGDDVLFLSHNSEAETHKKSHLKLPEDFHVMGASVTDDKTHILYYGSDFYYDFEVATSSLTRVDYIGRAKSKFFRNAGPDAVAMKGGKEYFFKGCKVVKQRRWGRRTNVRKFGLPCRPDAAWTSADGNDIVVLKGDQIWVWDGENKADEPKDFSSVYSITSWELIPSNDAK